MKYDEGGWGGGGSGEGEEGRGGEEIKVAGKDKVVDEKEEIEVVEWSRRRNESGGEWDGDGGIEVEAQKVGVEEKMEDDKMEDLKFRVEVEEVRV